MATLIRNLCLVKGEWIIEHTTTVSDTRCTSFKAVPLSTGKEQVSCLQGMLLTPDADLESLPTSVLKADIICLEIPEFNDGRAFSIATTLVERYGYEGQLMVSGPIIPEQIPKFVQCGVCNFLLMDEVDREYLSMQLSHCLVPETKASEV